MRRALIALLLVVAGLADARPPRGRVLRVCADPNSYPLSSKLGGIENEIAGVLARELGARLAFAWAPQRRGFVRNTLKAERCDVVIGVPAALDMVRTTAPYYRSAYAFVTRADRALDIRSFDDPRLRDLAIGVQLVGDDGANPPPVHALARRDIIDNVIGFNVVGDYAQPSPPAEIMRALEAGEIDVAIVWGPIAGGYARRARARFAITPVAELEDGGLPMAFAVAVGVRHADRALATELDRALVARRAEILRILDAWQVPRLALEGR